MPDPIADRRMITSDNWLTGKPDVGYVSHIQKSTTPAEVKGAVSVSEVSATKEKT